MQSEPPFPQLLQAEWARDQVMQLFDDLEAGANVEHVQLRDGDRDVTVSLADAKAAFVNRTAVAIQLRYRFEGETWCDTIMPGQPTTKIIRNRLPTLPERP